MAEDTLRDVRTGNNFYIDNILIDEYGPKIGVYGIAIYNVIVRHSNGNTGTNSFPSHATIARKVDCSVPMVKKTIKKLIELKLLKSIPRYKDSRRTSNEYWILNVQDTPPGYITDTPPRVSQVSSNNPTIDQSLTKNISATAEEPSPKQMNAAPITEKSDNSISPPDCEKKHNEYDKNGKPLNEHQRYFQKIAQAFDFNIDLMTQVDKGRMNKYTK